MKKSLAAHLTPVLLLCALLLNSFAFDARAQAVTQRDRRVSAPSTPLPQATPQTTPTPQATPTPQLTPTATPTPQPTPQPTPALPAPRTSEELRARIAEVLRQPALAPALFGIKVVSLDTGQVLFAENAEKLLVPASNMKLYTVAAALDRLGPDFRFTTSVYTRERPDAKGKVRGDLIIYGRGDPTFATRFNGGDYFKAIDDLAARIAAAGVRQIEGDLIGDESYFTGPPRGAGWEWDDLQWYYGADISALTVNDNAIDLFVKPGARVGDRCIVTTGPAFAQGVPGLPSANASPVLLTSAATTSPRGVKRELVIDRPIEDQVLHVRGTLPLDDPGFTASVSVKRPALVFASMLRSSLERQGVRIKGRTTVSDAQAREMLQTPFDAAQLIEIARRDSPPFSEIAAHTLKPSQNLYTELILRTLGKQFPPLEPKPTTAEAGISVVRKFLGEAGVDTSHLSLVDGSGLARQNLITAEATVQLLTYMSRHRHAQFYRDAQPIAGVDGTLRNRLKGTIAAGNVRAKTGTLGNVSGLSGYVTSAAGERLVFSMIVNHYPDDNPPRQNYLDAVAVLLASFAGKSSEVIGDK